MGITVRGAREHNLANLDVTLPTGALVVFCGPSGSGKSSLAFDTLHAEGQRRYLQALGMSSHAELQPPDVDAIDGLPPTLALSQHHRAPGPLETVGTLSGIAPALRLLFGRAGTLHCPRCDRPIRPRTPDGIVDDLFRGTPGARVTIEAPVRGGLDVLEELERAGFSRVRFAGEVHRLEDLRAAAPTAEGELTVVVDRVKLVGDRRGRIAESVRLAGRAGHGVVVATVDGVEHRWVDRPYCPHDDLSLPPLEPRLLSHRSGVGRCPACDGVGCEVCGGSRLSPAARAIRWRGHAVAALRDMPFGRLVELLATVEPSPVEAAILSDLSGRLRGLVELGLPDLVESAPAGEVSSGVVQRMRLARTVAASLGGVLYVLDEPTAGLDAEVSEAVLRVLRRLVAAGSTVVAVEHEAAILRGADHVVEFGPGAGQQGGQVVFSGRPEALLAGDTLTARWLTGRAGLPASRGRAPAGRLEVDGRDLPVGQLVAVTGPSGSGKTRFLDAIEAAIRAGGTPFERAVRADRPAGRSGRSSPATYVGLWDTLRTLLAQTREAQVRGFSSTTFSLNARGGRCEACKGRGEERVALEMLADVHVPCGVCDGRRFGSDVLEVRWKGLNASELLEADATTLRPILSGHPKLEAGLGALVRVGLGYVPIGQSTETLSGGEARRLALARELSRPVAASAYLLDAPTVGLHPADVAGLVEVLQDLVDRGASVFVATHDESLAKVADVQVALVP